jgi:hypothetical protein
LEYYQKALAIRKEIGDKAGEGASAQQLVVAVTTPGTVPKRLGVLSTSFSHS